MIVATGTTRVTTHGTATGWVAGSGSQPGHTATYATTQHTTTLTEAARTASPPRKRWNGLALVVIGLAVGGFGSWVGRELATGGIGPVVLDIGIAVVFGSALIVWGVVLAVGEATYNHDEYPGAYARWSRSWRCRRCGTVFEV